MQEDIRLLKKAARKNAPADNDTHVDGPMEAEEVEAEHRQRKQRDNATLNVVRFSYFLGLSN